MRIDDTKKMGTFTQYNSDCGKLTTTSAYLFFNEKKYIESLEDGRRVAG